MPKARAKKVEDMSGKGDNLRVAAACDSCKYAALNKAAYHGGKRITGLCLRYRSTPAINYNFSTYYINRMVYFFSSELRATENLDDKPDDVRFAEFVKRLPYEFRPLLRLYMSYMIQKGRDSELSEFISSGSRYYYDYIDARKIELKWVDNLADDLTLDDWPLMAAEWLRRGGRIEWGAADPMFDTSGATAEQILAPLRQECDKVLMYHRGWRDYFKNSSVTKIKRTNVCDNYEKLEGKRPRVDTQKLVL